MIEMKLSIFTIDDTVEASKTMLKISQQYNPFDKLDSIKTFQRGG